MQTSVAQKSTGYPDWHHLATHAMQYAMMKHDDEGKGMSPKQLIRYFGSRPDWSFLVHGAAWGFLTSHLRSSNQLLFSDDPLIRDHHQALIGSSANNGDEEVVLYVKRGKNVFTNICSSRKFVFNQQRSSSARPYEYGDDSRRSRQLTSRLQSKELSTTTTKKNSNRSSRSSGSRKKRRLLNAGGQYPPSTNFISSPFLQSAIHEYGDDDGQGHGGGGGGGEEGANTGGYNSNYIPKDTPWVDECHHGYGHGAFMFAVESLARANKPITVEEVCV